MSMTSKRSRSLIAVLVAAVFLAALPGCILIRTTEHRIAVNENGSGEAVLRLIDLRSDEMADSLVQRDFRIMMSSYEKEGAEQFSRQGRTITGKKLFTVADTLNAEITYTFEHLQAVEGMHVTDEEIYVVIPATRHVVRTNGKVKPWTGDAVRIVWKRDARRLLYQVTENTIPASTSLARFYRSLE
jgi:hypothetical protein